MIHKEATIAPRNSIIIFVLFLQISLQKVADRVEKAAKISLLRDNFKEKLLFQLVPMKTKHNKHGYINNNKN